MTGFSELQKMHELFPDIDWSVLPQFKLNEYLHEAVKVCDLALIRTLCKAGADVNTAWPEPMNYPSSGFLQLPVLSYNESIVVSAVKVGCLDTLKCLFEMGARLDHKDCTGGTLLHIAAEHQHVDIMRWLLDKGLDINAEAERKMTPLYYSLYLTRKTVAAHFLLDAGADYQRSTDNLETPLHWACEMKEWSLVKRLIEFGADIGAKSEIGETPLHAAVRALQPDETPFDPTVNQEWLAIVKLLIAKGAVVDARLGQVEITPLEIAIKTCPTEVVCFLIDQEKKGALKNERGAYCLTLACLKKREAVVKKLVEKGAAVPEELPEKIHHQLLLYFEGPKTRDELITAIKDLLGPDEIWVQDEYKAYPTSELKMMSIEQLTHLFETVFKSGHVHSIKVLVELGVDVRQIKLIDLPTPVEYEDVDPDEEMDLYLELVAYLIDHGAETESVNEEGATLLHCAAVSKNTRLTKLLLYKGANVNARNNNVQTPLLLILDAPGVDKSENDRELVEMLLEHGADVNVKDHWGGTPLEYACKNKDLYILKRLISCGVNFGYKDLASLGDNVPYDERAMRQTLTAPLKQMMNQLHHFDASTVPSWVKIIDDFHLDCSLRAKFLELFLKAGVDTNQATSEGKPLLHRLIELEDLDSVKLLLKAGADINCVDQQGRTPIMISTTPDIMHALFSQGADVYRKDEKGRTLLMGLCISTVGTAGWNTLQKWLVSEIARDAPKGYIDLKSDQSLTALHYAVIVKDAQLADILCRNSADVNIANSKGCSPLVSAIGCSEIMRILLEYGADPNSVDSKGKTALSHAEHSARFDAVALLKDHGALQ